ANNSGVDHHVFVVGIARQQLENPCKNPALGPTAETLMHALPIAKARRQITPRNAGSEPVQNGFNEQPVIRRRASDMAFATRQNILDPIPLIVTCTTAGIDILGWAYRLGVLDGRDGAGET